MLLSARRRGALAALGLVWAASLAACILVTPSDPVATFYLFPFRAWEMLTGVLLAIAMQARPAAAPGWAAPAGIVLILASVLLLRPAGFPGWQAAVPVAGTALVLWGARGADPVARALSHPAPVFVGLISYSLYLWHWPVLILSRYWQDGAEGPAATLGWVALSVVAAALSWRLVERPFRRPGAIPAPVLLPGVAAASAAALAFGALLYLRDGLPERFPPATQVHIAASQDFLQDWSRCRIAPDGPFAGIETCAIGPEGPPRAIIWGDSHLRALMDGLALAADRTGTPGLIIWHAGCPPVTGVIKQESAATPAQDAACAAATQRTLAGIAALAPLDTVMLVGRWTYYAEGSGVGRDARNRIVLSPDGDLAPAAEGQAALFASALRRTVATLAPLASRVLIFRQPPEIAGYDSRAAARALAHGRITAEEAAALATADPEALAARTAQAEAAVAAAAAAGATVIDPWPLICTPACSALQGGAGWYFDNNHLTNAGAIALAPLLAAALAGD
jgi:hypothetical protein